MKKLKELPELPKWHSDIHELPLKIYVRCAVNKELEALIISGNPAPGDLTSAWYKIQMDYADIIGDASLKKYLKVFQRYHYFESLIIELDLSLELIEKIAIRMTVVGKQFKLYPDLQDVLARYAARVNSAISRSLDFDLESYEDDIHSARSHIKSLELRMEIEALKMAKLQEDNAQSTKTITRDYFASMLISLSDHSKLKLDDSITVFEFAERIKRFQDYITQNRNTNGRRAHIGVH